jgi:hypothetical protein
MQKQVTAEQADRQDEIIVDGPDTVALLEQAIAGMQEHNQRALAQLEPHELARFETWLRTRTRVIPPVRPPSRPANGHAPREARNDRRRGSRRGERGTSSSSDDPDPPPKPCALDGCGRPRAHGERHCSAEHRLQDARERKQRQRARDRQDPEAARERIADYAVADNRPLEPSFCDCGSEAAYPFDHRWWCVPCGLPIEGEYSSVDGHLASRDVLDILDEQARLGARHGESEPLELHREPNPGPWPDRTYFDPTIVKDRSPRG